MNLATCTTSVADSDAVLMSELLSHIIIVITLHLYPLIWFYHLPVNFHSMEIKFGDDILYYTTVLMLSFVHGFVEM